MNIKPILGVALALCLVGCSSVTTSTLHCTPLSREQQDLIHSDLNRMLVSDGFTAANLSEVPSGPCWSNSSFSPLWKGRADFQIGEYTNTNGMDVDVFYYEGGVSANKALVKAIVGCVQSNAPSVTVKIKVKREVAPSWLGE